MAGLAAVFEILLGFLACAVTSMSLGIAFLRILRLDLRRAETVCIGYLIGCALTSTLTLVIAALWIAWKGVFLALAAASLILLWRQRPWLRALKPASFAAIPPAFRLIFYSALLAYGVLYFRQALSPEMSPDGMGYHLGLVNLWDHAHGLARNMSMHASKPQGLEMLFLFAFAIGRHSAAALVHYSFLMALPWLMVLFGCRFDWPRGGAVLAAVLTFASPLIGVDGTAAYNDVALAAVIFAALFLFTVWREQRTSGLLVASSVLTGFALALKSTAVFLVLFQVASIAWELRRTPRKFAAGTLLLAVLIMATLPVPYLIRNVVWFQNPVAHFGNAMFPNRWFHVSFEQSYTRSQAHLGGITWREMPCELTFGGPKMQESFGPAFVLLPLALAGLVWPQTRFLLLSALCAALPFAAIRSARFLIPALPLLTLAAAFVLCRLPRSPLLAAGIALLHLLASWPSVNNRFHISSGWRIAYHVPWRTALRQAPEEQCLARSDEYRMARLIEAHVPSGEPVLSLDASVAQAYTLRTVLVAWESAFAERMSDLILSAAWAPVHGSRTWTASLPETRIRELQIVQTGRGAWDSMWSVNEIRLSSGGTPLPPSPLWQLRAQPNPWDIALAFDGSEVTRWRSWDTLHPGTWIGIRFHQPLAVDTVEVITHDPQWESEMIATVLTENGDRRPAGHSFWRTLPPVDLRRQAAQELKRSGIRFLEMHRDVWTREPFRAECDAWGIHEVASTAHAVLLRVD